MKPMLAHTWEPRRVTFPCCVQPKLNGVRAVCGVDEHGRRRFQSRDELPWNYNVLEHISKALEWIPQDIVLDGELYVHGWSLQRINAAVTPIRLAPTEDTLSVRFMIFDRVEYTMPFTERMNSVQNGSGGWGGYLCNTEQYALVPTQVARNASDADGFYAAMIEAGYEGIMYRLGDCPYTVPKQEALLLGPYPGRISPRRGFLSDKDNRTWHLLKRKSWLDAEFPIKRVEEGVGKRAGMVGAIVFDCGNGREGRAGSGLSDADATRFLEDPDLILFKKIKVKFQTLTADGIPFHPTVEAII